MGLGLMNKPAKLCKIVTEADSEGFKFSQVLLLANIRVFIEERHGSEKWANLATFSEATHSFKFRAIPNLIVNTEQYILYNDVRYNIVSVENIKDRGMYIEVLAKKVESSNG